MSNGKIMKETVSVRIGESLHNKVQEFAQENKMSESDAIRQLVRDGLAANELEEELEEVHGRLDKLEEEVNKSLIERIL